MKNKYSFLLVSIVIAGIVLGVVGVVKAGIMIPAADKAKENAEVAVEKSPAIGGDRASTPPGLEKIEFIHWKKDFAKLEGAKAPKPPACYKFLTPTKIKWTVLPVSYEINPTNPQGLAEAFVTTAVSASAETWDAATKQGINE